MIGGLEERIHWARRLLVRHMPIFLRKLPLLDLTAILLLQLQLVLQRRCLRHLHDVAAHGRPLPKRLAPAQLQAGAGCRHQVQGVHWEGQARQCVHLGHRPPSRAALVIDGAAAESVAVARIQSGHDCSSEKQDKSREANQEGKHENP